ncbi:uncharacterized protein LOC116923328, partial [Daphnia magna]|uniref:uncharacterized protein LOC116923328 n=1 Tax=Daphnia magna TaxID=35525 RepID=UPI001E1BC070
MSDCGSLENVDPNESISGNNSSNEKKLELPSEFFELLGDAEGKKARMYRCLFEGCKMKFKKDGTQKPLISHDPNNSLGHKEKWRKAVDTLKESSDTHHITTRPSVQRISSQTHLDNWVMILLHCNNYAYFLRFEKMFSDNELRLATISNPMFKLSWLESEDDIRRAKSLLKCEYQRLQGVMEMSDSSEESSDGTSSSRSDPSPPKRAKKD